jgi:S1-C subfamily serine protease
MRIVFLLICFLFASQAVAQEESLVTIKVKLGGNSFAQGTGAVIKKLKDAPQDGYYSYILTAAHVIEGGSTFTLLYPNGVKVERAKLVSQNKTADVAVLEGWTPNSIPPIPLAEKVQEDEEIFVYSPRGVRRTKVSAMDENEIYADTFFVSGESGSPILNNKKEVVGVVSGGNHWFKDKKFEIRTDVRPESPKELRIGTWPARMGHIFSIRKIVK